jgi:hypothetical protein
MLFQKYKKMGKKFLSKIIWQKCYFSKRKKSSKTLFKIVFQRKIIMTIIFNEIMSFLYF